MHLDYLYLSLEIISFSIFVFTFIYIYKSFKNKNLKKVKFHISIFLFGVCLILVCNFPISVDCGCDFQSSPVECSIACSPEERTMQLVKIYEYYINDNVVLNYGDPNYINNS